METGQYGYLYHRVPADLMGKILYPLNQLKSIYPSLYLAKAAGYNNREAVMKARIPILDCLWNDVIHFSPVYPGKIQDALAQAGYARKQRKYFEVDPFDKGFNTSNAVIFLHQRINPEKFRLDETNFKAFDPGALRFLREIPEATAAYYQEMFAGGKRPLTYLHVPHILYRGTLDISNVKVIEVI